MEIQAMPSSKVFRDSVRRQRSVPGISRILRESFGRVLDSLRRRDVSLSDCLMS